MQETLLHQAQYDTQQDDSGIAGHPRGLAALCLTEMWGRISYFGTRSILILYMTTPASEGECGFNLIEAAQLYGLYTMSVYLTCLPGGYVADRFLGTWRSLLLGGLVIAIGHYLLAIPALTSFYAGLSLIALGSALLRPNLHSMVGRLYVERDSRRDSGFSILYIGMNIGALLGPLVCGTLAQQTEFKAFLTGVGLPEKYRWH